MKDGSIFSELSSMIRILYKFVSTLMIFLSVILTKYGSIQPTTVISVIN